MHTVHQIAATPNVLVFMGQYSYLTLNQKTNELVRGRQAPVK